MRLPRYLTCLLAACCLFSLVSAITLADGDSSPVFQPTISAKGAVLMDVNSGRLLFGRNQHQQLPMASTTKIMTAILAIESGKLDELVTVSNTAVKVEPSSIWLVAGEQMSLLHLVYGLMLRSGNDAACAIAEHLAGSVPAFAELMNQRAKELGMHNTNFKNPHGLPDPDHYTTAHDLAKLSAHALRNRQFSTIVSTTRFAIPCEAQGMTRVWHNKNRLLQTYPGADGVKTGWTRASGYCLVASANRNGQRLVAVVLNSPDDWGETAALLNYGFANYKSVLVVSSGQYLRTVEVDKGYPRYIAAVASDDFSWPVGKGEELELRYLLQLDQALTAPLRKGDAIGHLLLIQGTETVATLPVITDQDVVGGWWQQLLRSLLGNFTQLLLRRGEYA